MYNFAVPTALNAWIDHRSEGFDSLRRPHSGTCFLTPGRTGLMISGRTSSSETNSEP